MYLAIDLGTTGCRSIIFTEDWNIVGEFYEEYPLITEKEGYAEQDAMLWWELSKKTIKGSLSDAGIDGSLIKGLSISSQGITVVPVDKELKPLCNALTWLDVRAEEQTEKIKSDFGEDIFVHTGKNALACYTLPKVLWLMENKPEVFKKTHKFLMPLDFLTAMLCGKCITDHSMASGTLMYDIKNCCWSKTILSKYNIPKKMLPEIKRSGDMAGMLLPSVAKELGLSEVCTVAVGAQDQKCAALGAGLSEDCITISLGTAAAIEKMWNKPLTEDIKCVPWSSYCKEGRYVTEGVISTAGTSLRFVRDLLFKGEGYDIIDKEAKSAIETGNTLMFYPYLETGEGAFSGISLASNRGSFAAAVMEGIAFNIRKLLSNMSCKNEKLIVFGGGAKSDLWCRIISNVCDRKLCVPRTAEAAGTGAAMLAAETLGIKITPLDIVKIYTPDESAKMYNKKYEKYFQENTI